MDEKRKIAIVCNKLAGGGRSIQYSLQLLTALQSKKIRVQLHTESWPQHFNGFTDVWIVGGDGTLNYFINKYPEIKLPLVVFNGGTGNDVFSILYKEKNPEELVEIGLNAESKPVDAGRCNDRLFLNGVGIGFEGAVAKRLEGKRKTKSGKAAFMGTILQKIFFYRSKTYRIILNNSQTERTCLLMSIMNGKRAGGGFHIAPESEVDDGLLDIVMVDKLHPFQRLKCLPVIEKGAHLKLSFIKHIKSAKIIITSEIPMDAHLDGEYYSANRYEIEVLPAKFLFRY